MKLTERERIVLQLAKEGFSDYRIARKINTDPPSVTRSRKNAEKKLLNALIDLEWASKAGIDISQPQLSLIEGEEKRYNFFL